MARSNLKKREPQTSMAVDTVSGSPVYPCSITTSMLNALVLVRCLDRCTVAIVFARADFAAHAVGIAEFRVRSHTCNV